MGAMNHVVMIQKLHLLLRVMGHWTHWMLATLNTKFHRRQHIIVHLLSNANPVLICRFIKVQQNTLKAVQLCFLFFCEDLVSEPTLLPDASPNDPALPRDASKLSWFACKHCAFHPYSKQFLCL